MTAYLRTFWRALFALDDEILCELNQVREELRMATEAFTRLSGLIDKAVTAIETPPATSGTSDADLNALADKLDAALNPTTVSATADPTGTHHDANGVLIDDATGQAVAQ